jgi:hypothetical protein
MKRRALHLGELSLRGRGEAGTSLVIALAFLALLGSSVAILLKVDYTSFKTTEAVRGQQDRVYGADAGVDYGIQTMRTNTSYCPNTSSGTQSLPSQSIDNKTITVTCQTLSGSTGGGGGSYSTYSLIVTGYNNPDGTAPNLDGAINLDGKTHADSVQFTGPVFNAGGFTFGGSSPVMKITSNLDEYNDPPKAYCTNAQAANLTTGNLSVSGLWTCRLASTYPVPDPLPTLVVPAAAAPAAVNSGGCTILFPGKYTSAPTFDKNSQYYFASGVYYFANVGEIGLAGEIFGGQPGPTETQQMTTATPCSNDAAANALVPGSATGSGVELVLGGSSKLRVQDHMKNKIELFQRTPAVPASEGTAGISVYAPRTSGTNYVAWNADNVLAMDGNKTTMIMHGLFYAPDGYVNKAYALQNPGNAATFSGGMVVQRLVLYFDNQSSSGATASAASIIPPSPASVRTVVVTATATGAGEAPVTETAVIVLGTTSVTPPTVQSWRKN